MNLTVEWCISAWLSLIRVRADDEDSGYGQWTGNKEKFYTTLERRFCIFFFGQEDLSNPILLINSLLRKLEDLFIAILLFWLYGCGHRNCGRYRVGHSGPIWVMYHDPFVPLELALSEQGDGSLDFLFFAARGLRVPRITVEAIPPLYGG